MERLACVDAPAFALQLLLRRRPQWRGLPAAVVDRDAPHGVVQWVNEAARAKGVLAGLRYAAALALCPQLRATALDPSEVAAGIEQTCEELRRHSPHVEPSTDEPGVFWLDASGLEAWIASSSRAAGPRTPAAQRRASESRAAQAPTLFDAVESRPASAGERAHPPLQRWALATRDALACEGLECAIVVGFSHFGIYAIAKALRGGRVLVFESARDEQAFTLRVPLRRLHLEPRARAELELLGIWRVADLVALPAAGVRQRYGDELARLHALAARAVERELAPRAPSDDPTRTLALDFPTSDLELLLALVAELAAELLALLERRGQAAVELVLRLELEDSSCVEERLEPAEATLDFAPLARLLRLRLERRRLARAVQQIVLTLRGRVRRATTANLVSFDSGRDPSGAARAFAALRAAFGDDVVTRARPVNAHLPEVSFTWENVDALEAPRPTEPFAPTLVRRIFARAVALPARSRHEEDGWLLRGVTHGPVLRLHGPYPLNGGWWRAEVARDYHYAEMHSGALLWIYFDRVRRRWFLQGSVS